MIDRVFSIVSPPRAARVVAAVIAIHARGEQPTPGKVQRELGEVVRNGGDLNGRDSKAYAHAMTALGYVRVDVGVGQHIYRWRKKPS